MGVQTSMELVERVRKNALAEQTASATRLRKLLSDEVADLLADMPRPRVFGRGPMLTLVVGVNGVGKTTSIAKLARRHQQKGERVMLAAGDTFRAAAIEQLALWGDRLGVEVIRQGQGADPARRDLRRHPRRQGAQDRPAHRRHRRPPPHQGPPDGRARARCAG